MGKYVVKKVNTGFVFSLKAGNNEVIGVSEVYSTKAACHNGIASVTENAPVAAISDTTDDEAAQAKHPKFEIFLDKAKEFRFNLTAANGKVILSSEAYKQKGGCMKGIESVKANAASPTVEEN